MEISKTDKVGELLIVLGENIKLIDDKFADADGNIKLTNFQDVVEAVSLIYGTTKQVYTALGKNFEVAIPGPIGKIIDSILTSLDETPKQPV